MTENDLKPCPWEITDNELEAAFVGTCFGSATPREIIDESVLKIAGKYATGHTALVCCQELGLVGSNKRSPVLTKKGRRYLYHAYAKRPLEEAFTKENDRLREALEEIVNMGYSQSAAMNMPESAWQSRRAGNMQRIAKAALESIGKVE